MNKWHRIAVVAPCILAILLIGCGWSASSRAQKKVAKLEEVWLGIYLGEQKIGYASFITRPTTYQGKPAYVIESVNLIQANVLGQKMEETIVMKQISDTFWAPKKLTFTQKAQGRSSTLVADFFSNRIECKQVTEHRTTQKTVRIPKGVNLVADHQALMKKKTFKPGEIVHFYEFNPALLTVDKNTLEALGEEEVEIRGVKRRALAMKHRAKMGMGNLETKMWVDEEGEPLKMVSLLAITFIREPKEVAEKLPDATEKPLDIAFATSIKLQKPIHDPRRVKYLKLKVSGANNLRSMPQDARVHLSRIGDEGTLEIKSSEFDPKKSLTLPIKSSQYAALLKDGPYVEATDADIRKQAKAIVGSEKSAYLAAMKIRDWVHQRIHWQANIGVIRSAVDILKDPAGVCRDAAVLYTALARAAGLPTRIAAGLVYAPAPESGFFGHAWAETYVGEWVPIDPTLGGPKDAARGFVDATHIKLAQGEYTCFFDVVRGIAGLKFEVEEYR